jgi:hypothetical protein
MEKCRLKAYYSDVLRKHLYMKEYRRQETGNATLIRGNKCRRKLRAETARKNRPIERGRK